MKVVLACDHAGYPLKKEVIEVLREIKASFEDLGCDSETSVDYPDFASAVARKVSAGEAERGILLCGTGVGMAITANKFKGVRAAAIGDLFTAKASREHNDLNILCLGGRVVEAGVAREIVKTFIQTPFAGGRHEGRVGKIKDLEKKNCK